MAHNLHRAIDVRWCYMAFMQRDAYNQDRAYDCTREFGHKGQHDSPQAQEARREYQSHYPPHIGDDQQDQ